MQLKRQKHFQEKSRILKLTRVRFRVITVQNRILIKFCLKNLRGLVSVQLYHPIAIMRIILTVVFVNRKSFYANVDLKKNIFLQKTVLFP